MGLHTGRVLLLVVTELFTLECMGSACSVFVFAVEAGSAEICTPALLCGGMLGVGRDKVCGLERGKAGVAFKLSVGKSVGQRGRASV